MRSTPVKKNTAQHDQLIDTVIIGDARIETKAFARESIAVTITSPPYFDVKDYGRHNQIGFGQSYDEYLADLTEVFRNIYAATKSTGSLWLVVDTLRKGQEVIPLPFDIAAHLKSAGWVLRDVIIWKKDRTVPWLKEGATRKIFEYVLVFSKGSAPFKYDLSKYREQVDLKRWWVRYPERYNPNGKAPEEIWNYPIPTQGSWGDKYVRHFCPLPTELVERIVHTTTVPGDTVLDPFAGSGTVPTVSHMAGRHFLGIELNGEYVAMFRKHLAKQKIILRTPPRDSAVPGDFARTIARLRVLKFGRLLLRAIARALPEVQAKIFAFELKKPVGAMHKHFAGEYVVVCAKRSLHPKIKKLIDDIILRPPLSKFGIESNVIFASSSSDFSVARRRHTYAKYSLTNSHYASSEVPFAEALSQESGLYSPIVLKVIEPES